MPIVTSRGGSPEPVDSKESASWSTALPRLRAQCTTARAPALVAAPSHASTTSRQVRRKFHRAHPIGSVRIEHSSGLGKLHPMPALDRLHTTVRHALEKDGWSVTHDPLTLRAGSRSLYIDLGAEKLLAAEKGARRIAIEIKTFIGPSLIADLQQAVGQFVMYEAVLARIEPGRELYLAVPDEVLDTVLADDIGALMVEQTLTRVVSFSPRTEEVVRWIP